MCSSLKHNLFYDIPCVTTTIETKKNREAIFTDNFPPRKMINID